MAATRQPPRKKPTPQPRDRLNAIVDQLGVDEVRVLTSIAERLLFGAGAYGRLRLRTDKREFRRREAREEIEDFLVYLACAWLRALDRDTDRQRRRGRGGRSASRS